MIGRTIPWNASWTGEDSYEIRNCRWASGMPALWSPHRPGEGQPIFAKPHMVRQRRSIVEYRCTVCGECTDPHDRFFFGLGNTDITGWAFVTTEAPVHYKCARVAMHICPHLKSLGHGPAPWPTPSGILKSIVGGPATDRDFGLNLNGRKVVGHLKFAFRRMPPVLRRLTEASAT